MEQKIKSFNINNDSVDDCGIMFYQILKVSKECGFKVYYVAVYDMVRYISGVIKTYNVTKENISHRYNCSDFCGNLDINEIEKLNSFQVSVEKSQNVTVSKTNTSIIHTF